jgi:hypothetical protein
MCLSRLRICQLRSNLATSCSVSTLQSWDVGRFRIGTFKNDWLTSQKPQVYGGLGTWRWKLDASFPWHLPVHKVWRRWDMGVICFSFLRYRLRRWGFENGFTAWWSLKLGLRVSVSASHIETNLLPGNKLFITHVGLRGPRCANPRSYTAKKLISWCTAGRRRLGLRYTRVQRKWPSQFSFLCLFYSLRDSHTMETQWHKVRDMQYRHTLLAVLHPVFLRVLEAVRLCSAAFTSTSAVYRPRHGDWMMNF